MTSGKQAQAPEPTPTITLVMPAWNEEKYITPTLESVTAAAKHFEAERGGTVEIIVVDNGSTDHTAEIAEAWGCRVVSYTERHQMASVRNAGAKHARGEVICTLDADRSLVPEDVFCEIHDNLQDEKIFGGGANARPEYWTVGAVIFLVVIKTYMWIRNIGAIMFYMRTADFRELGGFNEEYWAVEDLEMAFRMRDLARSRGQRFRNLRGTVDVCMRKVGMVSTWKLLKLLWAMAFRPGIFRDRSAWDPLYYDVDSLR